MPGKYFNFRGIIVLFVQFYKYNSIGFLQIALCWGAMAGAIDIKLEAKACCCQRFML